MIKERKVCLLNASKSCEPSGFLLQRVLNFLKLNGYKVSASPEGCATVLVNTCCVTGSKRAESEAVLDRALAIPGRRVILFGCLSALPGKYSNKPGLVRIGPKELGKFNACFDWTVPIESVSAVSLERRSFTAYQRGLDKGDCYVLISQGCVNRCTFCSIKQAKGEVESRPEADILEDVRRGSRGGRRGVVLLADDCGSYGLDRGTDLAALAGKIAALYPSVKLKFSTLYPGALLRLLPGLKEHFRAGRISYVNIPLQSGSPRVLRRMGRGYDLGKVLNAVRLIRRLSPGTWTYTHIMVGFPGERREDFLLSVKASLVFHERMFIGYSDNPGTAAARLAPKVGAEELAGRLRTARGVLGAKRPGITVA